MRLELSASQQRGATLEAQLGAAGEQLRQLSEGAKAQNEVAGAAQEELRRRNAALQEELEAQRRRNEELDLEIGASQGGCCRKDVGRGAGAYRGWEGGGCWCQRMRARVHICTRY